MVEPVVEISDGKIRGFAGQNICGKTIYKFLGVPYGKTPVGDLRFKAPQPVEPWQGIKDATKDGDACYNRDMLHEHAKEIQGGEDCLVLNVFTRNINATDKLKPVMVYIHGGGYSMGCNKSEIYGPEYLLTQDVVVVVINYRLGLLGFISLEDESLDIPGNAGLKDQTLALKWVQKNVKVFGGDPNNVTIFGESAGSGSVHYQVLSPTAKGLFHKAILQSGIAYSSWGVSSFTGPFLAKALDKEGASDKDVFKIISNMTGKEVYELQEKIQDPLIFGVQRPYGPTIEKPNKSAFITRHPFEVVTSGDYNHVPLFIGYTSHEGLLLEIISRSRPEVDFYAMYTYRSAIPWFLNATDEKAKEIVELLSQFYTKLPESQQKQMAMMDSVLFSYIVSSVVNHVKTLKCPLYVYRASAVCQRNFFKQVHNIQDAEGTCHADELGFLWNIQSLPKVEQNTLEALTVQRFVKFWTNFAATGNPTPSNDFGVTLPSVTDTNNISILDIGSEVTVLQDLPKEERERIELWKKIFSFHPDSASYL